MRGSPVDVVSDPSLATPRIGPRNQRTAQRLALTLALTTIASLLCVAGAFVFLANRSWIPTFDNGLIWLRSVDVGTRNTPLVGPYSRFGWDHPGPAIYYVMAIPLRALGLRPSALLVGSLATALLSTATLLLTVFRYAGSGPGLVLAVSSLALSFGLSDRLIAPWNPFILVLPFALFSVCAWLWSDRHHRVLPIAVAAGSFCVQCHVGVAIGVLAIGLAACGLRAAAGPMDKSEVRTIGGSIALGVLMWAPPLFQQVTGAPGNLGRVAEFFFGGANPEPALGASLGLRIAASELMPWSSWLGFQRLGLLPVVEPASPALLCVPIGLLLMAAALARRHHDTLMLRFVVIVTAGLVACIYSFANIHGLPLAYLVVWPRVVAMFCVAAPLMVLARHARVIAVPPHLLAATTVCIVLAGQSVRGVTSDLPDAKQNRVHARFVPAIEAAVPPGTRVRVVATGTPFTVSPEALAIVLMRAGRIPLLQPWEARVPGPHRSITGSERLPTLALGSGPGVDVLAARPNGRRLAGFDPVSPAERAESRRIREVLVDQLRRVHRDELIVPLDDAQEWLLLSPPPGVDATLLSRYMKLIGGEQHRAYALFLFPETTW
jgi:hypothetical protein